MDQLGVLYDLVNVIVCISFYEFDIATAENCQFRVRNKAKPSTIPPPTPCIVVNLLCMM